MADWILFSLLAVTVVLLIGAEFRGIRKMILLFKPSATILVIALALNGLTQQTVSQTLFYGILSGLLLSLIGDIALIFTEKKKAFKTGLVFFLCAHIAYTTAFSLFGVVSFRDIISAVILAAVAAALYRIMRPNLGNLRLPVIIYMIVISLMVNRALATLPSQILAPAQKICIATGAVLFYVSDMMLALNRFGKPFRFNRISLAFYYSGQILLAMSPWVR